ncbi:MAG: hypothetical protein ACYC7J_11535 [Syntrophales bacterium]
MVQETARVFPVAGRGEFNPQANGAETMRDEDKTKEQLIGELAQLRRRVAELEQADGECKRMEAALQQKNQTCQELTVELEGKYRTIQWHDSLLKQNLEELNEKNARLAEYNRQLKRKRVTIRVLAVLIAIMLVALVVAASLGKVGHLFRVIYGYEDASYRPMDLERAGKPHALETGKGPAVDWGKKENPSRK